MLRHIPIVSTITNQFFLSVLLNSTTSSIPRIPRHNLEHNYVSMDTIYDESRTVYSRVVPRDPEYTKRLPKAEDAASCFLRESFIPEVNNNLNLLIGYYAQWFSHQFFNTNPDNPTHSNQPVGINLGQLYGATREIEERQRSFKDGLFKTSIRNGEEFPEIIENTGTFVKGSHIFNIPIPLANLVPGFAAVHIIFFRHHQYVARELKKANDINRIVMTDEELYQKAKMIVILSMLRMTMEDYVAKSLQSSHIKIKFDLNVKNSLVYKVFGPKNYPPVNAIQTEFNFLYRWHQFYNDYVKVLTSVPYNRLRRDPEHISNIETCDYECETLQFPKADSPLSERWNSVNWLAEKDDGLEKLILSAVGQRAGKLTLMNTNPWLVDHVVLRGIQKTREYEMASYNDYREHFGYTRLKKFEEITDDPKLVQKLKSVYRTVDDIEYYVGIFAEEKEFAGIHGPMLANSGVAFTFGGIFASRIFEPGLMNEESLTKRGMELIDEFQYMGDFVKAHTKLKDARIEFTMAPRSS